MESWTSQASPAEEGVIVQIDVCIGVEVKVLAGESRGDVRTGETNPELGHVAKIEAVRRAGAFCFALRAA